MSIIIIIIIILLLIFGPRILGFFLGCLISIPGLIVLAILRALGINNILNFSNLRFNNMNFNHNYGDNRQFDEAYMQKAVEIYIQLLGKIAKLDGVISQNEARYISTTLDQVAKTAAFRQHLKSLFNEAKNNPADYLNVANQLRSLGLGQMFLINYLRGLCQLAIIDGLNQAKVNAIVQIAQTWGFSAGQIEQILASMGVYFKQHNQQNQSGFERHYSLTKSQALKRLNLQEGASMDEIKRAYRKLAKEYHPDTLQSKGLSEEQIKQSTEKFKEINEAYEYLKNSQ